MYDKKEEKQIKETVNQLDDQLLIKISEMKDVFDKREQLILKLQRQLLENGKNLLEKKVLAAKNLCQLLARGNISVVSIKNNKEEAVDLKKEMKELLNCDELIKKRDELNIKIQFLEENNRQLIKYINNLYKKLSTKQKITVNNKLSNVQFDSPIFATNHPQIGAEQVTPDINM